MTLKSVILFFMSYVYADLRFGEIIDNYEHARNLENCGIMSAHLNECRNITSAIKKNSPFSESNNIMSDFNF